MCTRTFLRHINGPLSAATSQLQSELAGARTDIIGLQDITRIWASFHFLPKDLYSKVEHVSKHYRDKYHLICGPNGDLLVDTVELAKGKGLEAIGLAMHVLADTWAHANFAGTPSLVINNTDYNFFELREMEDGSTKRIPISFGHNPVTKDDLDKGAYTGSLYQSSERSIMNLGHGRAGHLPDYGFMKYEYVPAWANYKPIIKDNPSDYFHAFSQMVYALQYLRGTIDTFEKDTYDTERIAQYEEKIKQIIRTRKTNCSEEWKQFGESLSGQTIAPFTLETYEEEYLNATQEEKNNTVLGRFILAALAQKSMVTNRVFASNNYLMGFSVDFKRYGFRGLKDFRALLNQKEDRNL